MAVTYNSNLMGTFKAVQTYKEIKQTLKIEIREGNTLCTMIYKATDKSDNKDYWYLYSFYGDEKHLKNIEKNNNGNPFFDKVEDIRLNMYYPNCNILLKHFVKAGYVVKCYYKEPKKKNG